MTTNAGDSSSHWAEGFRACDVEKTSAGGAMCVKT